MNYHKYKLRKHSHLQLYQKIPRNTFNQGIKDLYLENGKTLNKETEEDTDKGKAMLWCG